MESPLRNFYERVLWFAGASQIIFGCAFILFSLSLVLFTPLAVVSNRWAFLALSAWIGLCLIVHGSWAMTRRSILGWLSVALFLGLFLGGFGFAAALSLWQ